MDVAMHKLEVFLAVANKKILKKHVCITYLFLLQIYHVPLGRSCPQHAAYIARLRTDAPHENPAPVNTSLNLLGDS